MLEKAKALLEEFGDRHRPALRNVAEESDHVMSACTTVARSWSGSYAGYHGRLYYGRFEVPPLDSQFSVEWGGRRGIPTGWKERSAEEVKQEIERLRMMLTGAARGVDHVMDQIRREFGSVCEASQSENK